MKIKNVHIKEFRRFTDLTVTNIPSTVRLIMLAGPNGSGKSSFFDALNTWHRFTWRQQHNWDNTYHRKVSSVVANSWTGNDVQVEFHDAEPTELREKKKAFYFRSAYRNDPEFDISRLTRIGDHLDSTRINRMIDNDAAVGVNYQRMASQGLEDIYEREDPQLTIGEFRDKTIGDIRAAMLRLFPDLELNSLGSPLSSGTFKFNKGISSGFLFKNLSGGEKAVFDLILDFVIARRDYDNTVFCIDEPESHMNTRLQAELLSVLYDLTPENCQLILATHSIGMMRRARDINLDQPGSAAFLNFGEKDFDAPAVLEPITPSRAFWQDAYSVALDDLAALVAPERVVICEGTPRGASRGRNNSHDARCYDRVFEKEYPDTRFVSGGNANDVSTDRLVLSEVLRSLMGGLKVIQLIDRDDRSETEISDELARGVRVLTRRNLESYLFDDEVLSALAESVGKPGLAADLLQKKAEALSNTPDAAADNLKPARGQIYNDCKSLLDLRACGNTTEAFMRDTLAPLLRPSMRTYRELRTDIFG